MSINSAFKALANASIDSALAFEWLKVDSDLSRGSVTTSSASSPGFVSTFEIVKSLRKPLDIIPASLHPVN